MAIFKENKKEPVRLHKKEPQKRFKINEMALIQLGVLLGILLLILLFLLICFTLIPKTYGFYWW